ncbi:MAG: glutamine--fructose-6-phosphate aminotransferase, partial [Clostridia bacterium]|nr:glutamine--fructose-6-phosphate aminotransferase [Clostridia bacterium]
RSRGARVLAIVTKEVVASTTVPADHCIVLPEISEQLAPFPAVCVLQLLAYSVAALKGLDVDKPRNLAKSVTVE